MGGISGVIDRLFSFTSGMAHTPSGNTDFLLSYHRQDSVSKERNDEKIEIPASKPKISMTPKYKSQYKRKIFKSYKEVFDFITKSVSMFDYLKKYYNLDAVSKKSFCCIFHTDEKASADIFKTDSGIELY